MPNFFRNILKGKSANPQSGGGPEGQPLSFGDSSSSKPLEKQTPEQDLAARLKQEASAHEVFEEAAETDKTTFTSPDLDLLSSYQKESENIWSQRRRGINNRVAAGSKEAREKANTLREQAVAYTREHGKIVNIEGVDQSAVTTREVEITGPNGESYIAVLKDFDRGGEKANSFGSTTYQLEVRYKGQGKSYSVEYRGTEFPQNSFEEASIENYGAVFTPSKSEPLTIQMDDEDRKSQKSESDLQAEATITDGFIKSAEAANIPIPEVPKEFRIPAGQEERVMAYVRSQPGVLWEYTRRNLGLDEDTPPQK